MKRNLYCVLLSLAMLSITGCLSHADIRETRVNLSEMLDPTPPTESDLLENNDVAENSTELSSFSQSTMIPEPLNLTGSVRATRSQPLAQARSPAQNYMSLMGQNGTVLTVWALARRNWLWAYAPIDSQNFGNIRNWRLERGFSQERFRFVNQQLNTCIQAQGNGLIHDTCNKNNLAQEFELLPRSNGSVFLKSVSQNRCVTYNPVSTTVYSTITLQSCTDDVTPLKDQSWYLAPPILAANPQI